MFLIIIWLCWKNRNRLWHEQEGWNIDQAVIVGKSLLKLLESPCCPLPLRNSDLSGTWSPPIAGVVKVNSDGAWDRESRNAGVGIIARDHLGCALWVWAEGLNQCLSSSEVEGQAFSLSLKLAQKLNVKKALFEVDSLEVYKAISIGAGLDDWCSSWLGAAVDLLRRYPGWEVKFTNREANKAADSLARKARLYQWSWKTLDSIPWWLGELV
ncbi:hypothetical protein QQ045_018144 [Rhodiola kirilowii]